MTTNTIRHFSFSRRAALALLALTVALSVVLAATSVDSAAFAWLRSEPIAASEPVPAWLQPEYSPDRGFTRKPVAYEHMYRSERSGSRR